VSQNAFRAGIDLTMESSMTISWDAGVAPPVRSFSPIVRAIAMLKEEDRTKLIDFVRSEVTCPDGKIAYSARANAVRGQVASKR
jgi:hypothetical protein